MVIATGLSVSAPVVRFVGVSAPSPPATIVRFALGLQLFVEREVEPREGPEGQKRGRVALVDARETFGSHDRTKGMR